ncbi:MAG TPA: hypothetical protein VEM41_13290 [Actinomycetota bacterium]|nr:hypothetical protein [Actinomycetota bacterium]
MTESRSTAAVVRATMATVVHEPVVAIMLVAAFFDGISGNPIHALLLGGVAIVLGRDIALGEPNPPIPLVERGMWIPGGWTVAAFSAAFALVVGAFPRYSWPATVGVVAAAAAAIAVAWRGPLVVHADPGPLPRRGVVAWSTVLVAGALWELEALLLQPSLTLDSQQHPTISTLTDPVLSTHAGRTLIMLAWLLVGWFLMRQ